MLKLFERNTVIQVTIILVVTTLLWFSAFADPKPMVASEGFAPLYNLFCSFAIPPVLTVIIALALVILGALGFNIMLSNVGLAKQNSLFLTLFFIIFMSTGRPSLSPELLATLTAIPFVNRFLLHSSHLDIAPDKVFSAASLIGIASMLYLPSLALVVAYLLIAINHRLYGWRNWMMFLLGLLAPYLLLWTILFFTGGLTSSFVAIGEQFGSLHLHGDNFTTLQAVANIFLVSSLLVSIIVVWNRLGESNVIWQKNATTVMLIAVASLVVLPFSQLFPINLQFFAIPFAFCLDQCLFHTHRRSSSRHKKDWHAYLYDLLFILIILAALVC